MINDEFEVVCIECGGVPEDEGNLEGWIEDEFGQVCPACAPEVTARAASEKEADVQAIAGAGLATLLVSAAKVKGLEQKEAAFLGDEGEKE